MTKDNPLKLSRRLKYEFTNLDLLIEALHHASAKRMMKNERLEFLGDRVLGLIMAEYLYINHPLEQEGDMAKRLASLVSRQSCALVAVQLDMSAAVIFDKGVKQNSVTKNVLANICEAVIAAIYLDGGLQAARKFVLYGWRDIIKEMIDVPTNAKSALQEFTVAHGFGMPQYNNIGQEGPAHKPIISVDVRIETKDKGELVAQAQSSSRKEAENLAAEYLLAKLKEI